jgi:high-affinity nickel-transport protein
MAVGTSEPVSSRSLARVVALFTPREWAKLGGLYGFIVVLHVVGWGLFVGMASRYPAFAGAGVLAYTFGLRHAFDADHISAIDDTTRFMLQKGKRPLGVGFFFSLGHSSIVFGLSLALAIAARAVESRIPEWQNLGGTIGASVSGVFLWAIGCST